MSNFKKLLSDKCNWKYLENFYTRQIDAQGTSHNQEFCSGYNLEIKLVVVVVVDIKMLRTRRCLILISFASRPENLIFLDTATKRTYMLIVHTR